jgi:hypothetical protein
VNRRIALVSAVWAALLVTSACRPSRRLPEEPQATHATPTWDLDVTVRPVRDRGAEVRAVAVRETFRGALDQRGGPLSLRVGIVYVGRAGIADRVDSLVMRDASGVVPLGIENDPVNPGGYPYYRHWRAQRTVRPPVIVTYRMRPVQKPTGGPQFEFYAHGGGISSHGSQLFVLPESLGIANIHLKWDLGELVRGSTAVSTYGEGDIRLRARADTLVDPFFLVGPLGRYQPPAASTGFRAYWLGRPEYDSRKEMAWLYQAYENMRRFYRDSSTSPYRVFIRAVGYGGGTASGRSFMTAVNAGTEDSTRRAPRNNVAHEIGHFFVGGLAGDETGEAPWYDEGVNTHYTRLLLLRAGLAPVSDFLTEVNNHARGYYTNPYRNFTADSIRLIGFSTGFGGAGAQNLAYTRGSLFWADVDRRIRDASGGRRKLDDVLVPLLVARRNGLPLTQGVLFDALARELGSSFREHFDAVITRGKTLVPAPGAFGPCFQRKDTTYAVQGGGAAVTAVAWERATSVPDETCREW